MVIAPNLAERKVNDDTVRDYPKRAQTTATPTIARSLTFSKYKSRSHREPLPKRHPLDTLTVSHFAR
jgi:hypothetical protein